jgi:hypothetical protein
VKLDELSVFIEGATNGGEAATTGFATDSQPLEGRLAPGVSATKTDDNALETKYGVADRAHGRDALAGRVVQLQSR